jgi:membrane associated rhomboid family serine protease
MIAMLELVVAVAAAYWGWFYLARGRRLYGLIAIGAGAASAVGGLGPQLELSAQTAGLVGGLGALAVVLVLVVGPACRAAARVVVQSDRLALAGALLEIADVLMPGAGVGDDKLALAALREVRAGRIDETVAALEDGKRRLPASLGRAIDERITMLYLSAHRWKEAIDHADRTLAADPEPAAPAQAPPPPPQDAWTAARAALGMSPPLWVEVLGAVAREGDLERAAAMLQQLEQVCGERDDAYWIRHRGRLVFLAFAGRTAAVDRLIAPDVAAHMTRSARSYWRGIAAAHAGDTTAAEGAYQAALVGSRGRARDLVTRALDELPRPAAPASERVQAVADAIEAAPLARPEQATRPRRIATWALVGINAAVAAVIAVAYGSTSDPAVVIRAGGALRGAIDAGEWWRLVATTAVHIGVVHLVLNLLALFAIGRWCESIFGGRAVAAIYVAGGLAGAAASYLIGAAPVSAGASGAIFGVLGALMVELVLYRRTYRRAWQSGMMGALLIAVAAQLALGYSFPQDQWAHAGGFVAGAVLGLALSPQRRRRRVVAVASGVIAAAGAVLAVIAAVMVARTDFGTTLARYPRVTRVVDGLAITVPARWQLDEGSALVDPDLYLAVRLERGAPEAWVRGEPTRATQLGFQTVAPAATPILTVPAGWLGSELVATYEDDYVAQRSRVLALGRPDGVVATIYVPEALARDAAPQLAAMVASIEDRRPAPAPAAPMAPAERAPEAPAPAP